MIRKVIPLLFPLGVFSLSILIYNPNDYDLINFQVKVYVENYTGIFLDKDLTKPAVYCFEQEDGNCNETPSSWAWVKVNISGKSFISLYLGNGNYAKKGEEVFEILELFNYPNGTISPDGWTAYHYYLKTPEENQEVEYFVNEEKEYYGYVKSYNSWSHARRGL